jgi:GTP1/Obg family GTP-binding protein
MPTVQFDVVSIVKSKKRIKALVSKYNRQIRKSNDNEYISVRQRKIGILKEILKTYTQLLEE